MSEQTKQPNAELLNTQLNAEETKDFRENYSNKIIERIPLENTPFVMIRTEEGKCFGTMMRYKMTKDYETIPELETYLLDKSWELMIKVVGIIVEDMIKEK